MTPGKFLLMFGPRLLSYDDVKVIAEALTQYVDNYDGETTAEADRAERLLEQFNTIIMQANGVEP